MGAPKGVCGIHPTVIQNYPPVNRTSRHPDKEDFWFRCEIAPTALIEAGVKIQQGDTRPTIIGESAWIMTDVTVSHDVQIGDLAEVSHGTRLGGYVTIEKGAKLGMGVVVRPFVTIGEYAVVGAGAVVVKDVPAGETWVGNPAARMEKAPSGPGVPSPINDDAVGVASWKKWWDKVHAPAAA